MAKARKSTIKRAKATNSLRRATPTAARRSVGSGRIGRIVLGPLIGIVLVGGIGFFGLMGYKTAIASEFFGIRRIVVSGNDRVNADDIRRIVSANTERTGVWQADIAAIREKIEKLPFVRSAAVSMVLPGGVRVNVIERVPLAVVKIGAGDFLVDGEGVVLAPVAKAEGNLPFTMRGWDEAKSEKAMADNLARLKLYKKMLEDWKDIGLVDRVSEVNLTNTREPEAVIADSGRQITITVAKDNLGKSLKSAIDAVAGKGEKVRAVNSGGVYPVLEYLAY